MRGVEAFRISFLFSFLYLTENLTVVYGSMDLCCCFESSVSLRLFDILHICVLHF
jgi:hypothetical protein